MRLTGRVEVNMNTAAVKARGKGFSRDFADTLGELVQRNAKHNVEPGVGPGPHPHNPGWTHVDTGNLRDSIQIELQSRGFLETTMVFTDLPYGLFLEFGYTTLTGRFIRYPWLQPAMDAARSESNGIAQSTARSWFSETGSFSAGRVNFLKDIAALKKVWRAGKMAW